MSAILRTRERVRLEGALHRFDYHLSKGVIGRPRREIIHELRANLRASAADGHVSDAVAALGDLRTLAAEYVDAVNQRVRPLTGTLYAVVVFAVYLFVHGFVIDAYLDGWQDAGGNSTRHSVGFATGTVDGTARTSEIDLLPGLGIALLVFVLTGRLWRAFRRWRPTPVDEAPRR